MVKEPYNLFADAGSTLPGGSMYEDLLVILKAVVMDNGGTLEVSEENLMFVDRDEMLRVDDVFIDGKNRKVFSIQTKQSNQNPEGCVAHGGADEDNPDEPPLMLKIIAGIIWACIIFSALYLLWQVLRVVV